MDTGLDELIESLLIEIAFSGVRGCSVSALLKAIESFYRRAQDAIDASVGSHPGKGHEPGDANGSSANSTHEAPTQRNTNGCDLSTGSKVWRWLVVRTDVSVGTNRQFNHLSLDNILALPEEEDNPPPTDDAKELKNTADTSAKNQQRPPKAPRGPKETPQRYRPRLHVSEERQWKTLAGHGPDLKRIPLFEWKALVDIASMRDKGILQGDLVRLSGQDKRSLPTRTDALAKKGYIIKQPIILRGCRSSKLWLAQFADSAKEGRDGLNFDKVDLSKEALTKDLAPVPFSDSWNGERLDYIAIAQAFNAVLKSWGIMRYCDMRTKLDANRVPQMRALAKTSRWFTSIGAATFVAARFANGQRLFKDCVKFIREPTAEEWRVFRSTPSAHIKVPSARLGKRGQASRARHSKETKPSPHSQVKLKKSTDKQCRTKSPSQEELIPSLWTPYKPMVNTVFEIIKRAGREGSSNGEIGRLTLGHSYRKYIAALTGTLSLPNSQPPHLNHFDVTSQLNRLGKTMTYQFFASGEISSTSGGPDQETNATPQVLDEGTSQRNPAASARNYPFSRVIPSKFAPVAASSLSQLHYKLLGSRPEQSRKRKRIFYEEPTKGTSGDRARRSKIPRTEELPSAETQTGQKPMDDQGADSRRTGSDSSPISNLKQPIGGSEMPVFSRQSLQASPSLAPRQPGVYREPDNLLDPPGKRGRRKKSLVLAFRFDSLKDSSFLERMRNRRLVGPGEAPPRQTEPSPATNPRQSPSQEDGPKAPEEKNITKTRQKPIRRDGKAIYRCDKCGNSWKNSNGLEYHINKSRTTCNPEYVPLPPPPPKLPRQPPKARMSQGPTDQNEDKTPSRHNSKIEIRRPLLPSKRVRAREAHVRSKEPREITSVRGSIVLQDMEAYDVIDHRRRRENNQTASASINSLGSQLRRTSRALSQGVPTERPIPQASKLNETPGSGAKKSQKVSSRDVNLTNTGSRAAKPADRQGARIEERAEVQAGSHSQAKQTNNSNDTPISVDSNLRPASPKPAVVAGRSSSEIAMAALNHSTNTNAVEIGRPNSDSPQLNQQSSPKKPRKPYMKTIGALRRERTVQIIQYLLDNNDGVFPGQRSLYLAMVSIWVKRHSDLEPPDWKVCQNVVNNMQKSKSLLQLHFCFLDDNGKLQENCVLAKLGPGETNTADLASDPKVVVLKEKMREIFPESYIPEAFSLSREEGQLFSTLTSGYGNTKRPNEGRKQQRSSNATEDIEVLPYSARVLDEIPVHSGGTKRHMEDELTHGSPTKKARLDARNTSKPRSAPKTRKRGEYWETGKVAKYIWNQKQNSSEKWNQTHACLQNFSTGAWSVLPQGVTSRPIREKASALIRGRSNGKPRASGKSDAGSFETILWDYFQSDGNDGLVPKSRRFTPDRFVMTSFESDDSASEDDEDDTFVIDAQHDEILDEDLSPVSDETGVRFTRNKTLQSTQTGCWPWLSSSFFESTSTSFILAGAMPHAKWFQRENLPQSAEELMKTFRGRFQFNSWADPSYGKFLREVDIIEKWEQSSEGTRNLMHGSIAPDYIFISLSPDASKVNMKPTTLEWPSKNQLTAENIPDEVKNSAPEDDNVGLPEFVHRARGRPKKKPRTDGETFEPIVRRPVNKAQLTSVFEPEIQYTTRSLKPIPIQNRGRVNKPNPNEEKFGLSGETELIAAFVVFKTLLGGVDKKIDIGSILMTFPQFSHSSLKKFWPKVCKERKTYIDALTSKFQSAFLEVYEAGDIPPLDYDDLDSYDWRSLIIWATKLETHENVDLPATRHDLDEAYSLEEAVDKAPDWRETWHQNIVAIYSRISAIASEPISIPLSSGVTAEEELISRARSWVRSLCVTPIKSAKMPDEIRAKLVRLSGGNEAKTNKLLKKVVGRLTSERIAARGKGKILGQSLRLHGVFAKQLEKASIVKKFVQAAKFKTILDERFRQGRGYDLPYISNDGAIMAVINLQATGRIHAKGLNIPRIPFGFDPGNYDGRTFPKTYYHFDLTLFPTESYLYDEDLPLLQQAARMDAPRQGPQDEIPIWVDFFGGFDKSRWITYLTMITLALATKGPLTPHTASVLMKPFVEPFEAKLVMDWIDSLGLLQRIESDKSATVGEWWWLVVGKLAQEVAAWNSAARG